MQAIRADYFGRRAIGMILGLSSLIIVFGQIGGPMIAGLLADATGSYLSGFTLLAAHGRGGLALFPLREATAPGAGRLSRGVPRGLLRLRHLPGQRNRWSTATAVTE